MPAADHYIRAEDFPNLDAEGFVHTSSRTTGYNCIAWSLSNNTHFWWPEYNPINGYWPTFLPFNDTIATFRQLYALYGYVDCFDSDHVTGVEKVAIYAKGNAVKHAARQLPCGLWTSKLGRNIDIKHTLRGLEGPCYGIVVSIMQRPTPAGAAND